MIFRYYNFLMRSGKAGMLNKHIFFLAALMLVCGVLFPWNTAAQCGAINFKANGLTRSCPLLVVNFSAIGTSSSAGTTFQWDFGNGFVNGGDTITNAFATPGQYTIKMLATLAGSNTPCPAVVKDTFITVLPIPVPSISANTGFVDCFGHSDTTSITFTDNTPGVASRKWYIQGDSDTARQFKYTFPNPGTYDVNLYITNKYNCSGFVHKTEKIVVAVPLDICATFTVTTSGIKGTYTPQIGNTGNRTITGYLWSFPGGSPSSDTAKYPLPVTYSDPTKKYDASLTITMSDGCIYSIDRKAIAESVLSPAFQTECATGFIVNGDLTGGKGSWDFNFPSGNYISINPMVPPPPGLLSYGEGGSYSASTSFIYNTGPGCRITVNYPFFVNALGPRAAFNSTDNQICNIYDTVHLINTSDTTNASNVSYTWYFFDSTDTKLLATNNKIGPTSNYDTFYIPGRLGKFGVSLVASSPDGCKDSSNIPNFIISAKPKSNFDSLLKPIYCYGSQISLISDPTPPEGQTFNYKYKWHVQNERFYGLPDSATSANDTYSSDSLGIYDVSLSISNGHCSSDTFKPAFFRIIGDLTRVIVADNTGCLNPNFTTTVSVGREEKFPNDPNNPPLYHWYLDPDDDEESKYIQFSDPNSPSTQVTITHSGCYAIYLNISTIDGIDTCVQKYPTAGGPGASICVGPALDFGVGQFTCPGDTVNITNYSPSDDFGFKWSISPPGLASIYPSDTSKNIKVVFHADTCYNVMLSGSRTLNGVTCSDADTVSGFCYQLPKPDFYTTTPTFFCAPSVGTFVNTTKNASQATGFIWYFGDGDTLFTTDSNSVSHVYLQFRKGEYDVTLTALNQYGCNETITKKTAINITGSVPLFTMDQNTGCDSLLVNFTNISKNVKKFLFLYGDGLIDSVNPALPSHLYSLDLNGSNSGLDSIIYYPTLQSLDDTASCHTDYFVDTIKLYKIPADIIIKNDVSLGCTPLTVQFSAISQAANQWRWDFNGDGIIDDSTDQNPVFTYTKPGIYRATLTVTNHGSCPYTVFSDTIIVAPNTSASFTPSEKTFCGTQDISFTNTSKNSVRFVFNYGDGSLNDSNAISTHKYYYDPSHDTGQAVFFYPSLISYNAGGCSDTTTDTITAYRMPVPGFSYSAITGCSPLKVQFKDTSKYNFATEWDFDNSGTIDGFGKTIDWIYAFGLYTVKMRAITIEGCVDSTVKVNLVTVNAVPVANFSVSDSDICYQGTVAFDNLTQPADSIVQWSWKFNDPAAPYDTSSAKNPSFTFYAKGWHVVTLTAVDNKGCSDTISKKAVFVEDTVPPPDVSINYVSVMDTHNIQISYNRSNISHFESYKINRLSNGVRVVTDTVNNVNDTMFTYYGDTSINTSDSSYCFSIQALNQCGKVSFGSVVHCTILLNGNANTGPVNVLNWSAYSGWNVSWYYIYRADSGGTFKIIDSVGGNILTWSDTSLCDETYCYYIAAKNDANGFVSNSNSICLKAKYVRQTAQPYIRYATVVNNSVIGLKWDTSGFKGLVGYQLGRYSKSKGWIDNYAVVRSNTYIDNLANINDSSYTYQVRTIDKCGYLGPESNIGTSILLKQNINEDNIALNWNSYGNWQAGVQNYILQVQLKNNQFKTVARLAGNDTSYTDDSVYNAIDTAYCYRVIAIENGTRQDSSISNLTCAVLPSRIFVPNAFSPNGDSLNDVWKVSAISVYNVIGSQLNQFSMDVYNRWGSLVFESDDIYKGWDGTFKGEKAPADVYIYIISAEGIDKKYIQLKGNVTLLR